MVKESSESVPSKYEIAEPLSYESFAMDAAAPQVVPSAEAVEAAKTPVKAEEKAVARTVPGAQPKTGKPESWQKDWSDADKVQPAVKPENAKEFEAPDPAGGKVDYSKSVAREKRAIWIVHGMGQQIPFETVDSLTHGVLDAIQPRTAKPRLRTVKIGGQVLQRVELDVDGAEKDSSGEVKHYELHLYESYWAPKTEGVAKLTDVIGFLWDGGTRGLLNSWKKFKRAMFGGMALFSVHVTTPIWLCLALLILTALAVINGVVLAAAAARTGLPILNSLVGNWEKLTALASCMIAVAFTFGVVLFTSDMSKPQTLKPGWRVFIGVIGWVAAIIAMADIVGTALLMAAITHLDWTKGDTVAAQTGWFVNARTAMERFFMSIPSAQLQGFATRVILGAGILVVLAMITRAILQSAEKSAQSYPALRIFPVLAFALNLMAIFGCIRVWMRCGPETATSSILQSSLWVWPFLILFSAKVRELMVQYVGDVAIYVTSNKLDRFDEVRSKIKDAARSVASAVFTAYAPGPAKEFLYAHVAVVGHSLGSVIAYDTVNRLMLDDWLAGHTLGIAERTKTMVTFGSPLNKTAFLFTMQGKDSLRIRERLAGTVQPLIISYPKFRKLNWINVYSHNDIISGALKFYDLPGFQDPAPPGSTGPWPPREAVRNVIDKDAAVPIMAHVSYWKNKTVWNELLAQIAP